MLTKGDLSAIQEMLDATLDSKLDSKLDLKLAGIKSDIGSLKTDVGTLKADVGSLKSDVSILKADLKKLSDKLDTNTKELTDLILAGFATHERERMIQATLESLSKLSYPKDKFEMVVVDNPE